MDFIIETLQRVVWGDFICWHLSFTAPKFVPKLNGQLYTYKIYIAVHLDNPIK